jgi:hypothetical protein
VHILQDEGTIGVETMQAFRTWVCPSLLPSARVFDLDMGANGFTVVTRRPRVLRWCSRCSAMMAPFFMWAWDGWWILRIYIGLRWMEQGTDKTVDGLGLCILFCIAEGA